MNYEELQDWLSDLHKFFFHGYKHQENQEVNSEHDLSFLQTGPDVQQWSQILHQLAPQTNMLLSQLHSHFDDSHLKEPLITQLLSLYYKFGIARCFVLQLVPTFIQAYLKAIAKRWYALAKMLEMFFLAVYNEEILTAGPGTPSLAKRTDEIRLPTLRSHAQCKATVSSASSALASQQQQQQSSSLLKTAVSSSADKSNDSPSFAPRSVSNIKICVLPEELDDEKDSQSTLKSCTKGKGEAQQGQRLSFNATTIDSGIASSSLLGGFQKRSSRSSVRIGPYPAIERIIAENRFIVLTRLVIAINYLMPNMDPEIVCRSLCHSLLYICRSGFPFQESDFRQRVLRECASSEILTDFSRKSRIRNVPSQFFIECINGLTFSLLNGQTDIALRALDALHQRAQYEIMADVQLSTNALRQALADPRTIQAILADEEKRKRL